MTPNELEAYDAMMKDRDRWKSLYFTMRELSDNATEIAERREQENTELREAAQAVIDRWNTPLWREAEPTAAAINRLRETLNDR
jgi:hypothetical protein